VGIAFCSTLPPDLQNYSGDFQKEKAMIRSRMRDFAPVALLFILINGFLVAGRTWLQRWDADQGVLIAGNLLLFLVTLFSFLLAKRGLRNPNPHHFVRSVYTSILVKLFACMIAALVYIATNKQNLNKPALFTLMALYLVYTFLEVSVLMRMLRNNKANG
jgi:Ca2+/Na+ antiporter